MMAAGPPGNAGVRVAEKGRSGGTLLLTAAQHNAEVVVITLSFTIRRPRGESEALSGQRLPIGLG